MIDAQWHTYDTSGEMADAVAEDIGLAIEGALDTRSQALVALPGGKSPIPVFERLAAVAINWERVTIIPTDDRLVPVTDPLSNVAVIARHFLPREARTSCRSRSKGRPITARPARQPMRGWPISNGRRILFGSASAPTDTPHRSFQALISRKRWTAPRPVGRSV